MNDASPTLGPRYVLGVTGGIAAYKAAELVRLLVKDGATVDVVMTAAAQHFVTATTFQALSGRAVLTDLWATGADNAMATAHWPLHEALKLAMYSSWVKNTPRPCTPRFWIRMARRR